MNIFTINNNTGSCKSQACSPASRSSVGKNWMLRLFSLLLVLCMSCGAAWAITGFTITGYSYDNGQYKVKFYVTTDDGLGAWMRVKEQGNESNEVRAQDSWFLGTRRGFEGQITLSSPNATLVAEKRNVAGVWLTSSQKTLSVSESDFVKVDLDNFTYANTYVGVIRTDTLSCIAKVTSSLDLEGVQFTWKYPHLLYNKNQNGTSSYKNTEFLEEQNTSAERIYYFNMINHNDLPIEVSCVKDGITYSAKQTVTREDLLLLDLNDFNREYTDFLVGNDQNNNSDVTFDAILLPGEKVVIASQNWRTETTAQFINPSDNKATIKVKDIQARNYLIISDVKDSNNKSYSVKYELREGDLAVIALGSKYVFDNSDGTNHFYREISTRSSGAFNAITDAVWADDKGWSQTVKTNQKVNFPLYKEKSDIVLDTFDKYGRRHHVTRHGMVALWSKFTPSSGSYDISNGQELVFIANASSTQANTRSQDKDFQLVNDIDLSGAWWDINGSKYFKGRLDGKGYSIIDMDMKIEKSGTYALFPNITGKKDENDVQYNDKDEEIIVEYDPIYAGVKNLTIKDVKITYAVEGLAGTTNIAALAGSVTKYVQIDSCNVVNANLAVADGVNSTITGGVQFKVGGLIANANGLTERITNARVQFNADLRGIRYEASASPGSRYMVGGIFGYLYHPLEMPENMLYSGKLAAPNAYIGPIFGTSYSSASLTSSASNGYAGEFFYKYTNNESVDEVLKAVDTWFYKDYYVYVSDATKNNAEYNTTDDEGATVVPQYDGQYVKCTDEFPAKAYAAKAYKLGGYRSLLYSSSGADGDITKMTYLQGVNLGNYIETDFDEFPFVLYDGDVYDRSKPFTVPSFSYVRTFKNTNWSSVFIPAELEYDDWKDKVDIAKFWDVNVYLPSSSATKPELGVNTEIQVLILAKGDRIKPNVPYLIRLKDEALAGTELWFTHKDYKNGVKVEDADNRHILSCSDVETNFTFYGHYNEETDPQSLSTKWYALTHEGWWCAASKTAKLSPERVFVTIEGKNATKFYPELYKDGEPLFRDEMKAPTLRINVLNESEEMGETAIEQIAQNYGNEGDEVTRIPSSVIGLKAGNYVIGGKQIVVE